jgi:hypothetical protein
MKAWPKNAHHILIRRANIPQNSQTKMGEKIIPKVILTWYFRLFTFSIWCRRVLHGVPVSDDQKGNSIDGIVIALLRRQPSEWTEQKGRLSAVTPSLTLTSSSVLVLQLRTILRR